MKQALFLSAIAMTFLPTISFAQQVNTATAHPFSGSQPDMAVPTAHPFAGPSLPDHPAPVAHPIGGGQPDFPATAGQPKSSVTKR